MKSAFAYFGNQFLQSEDDKHHNPSACCGEHPASLPFFRLLLAILLLSEVMVEHIDPAVFDHVHSGKLHHLTDL